MDVLYDDPCIRCDAQRLTIRGYYFPFGNPKVVAYRDIQSVTPVKIGVWTGKWRLWGTSSPRYWLHLDLSRPRKDTALVLDLGRTVRPVITPTDPARVTAIIESHLRAR